MMCVHWKLKYEAIYTEVSDQNRTRCCVTFQLFMWSANPQEFCFLHFTINTMKDRSRRHLGHSGITCSECPFSNLTWSLITNTLPVKAERLINTTISGFLSCLNIFFTRLLRYLEDLWLKAPISSYFPPDKPIRFLPQLSRELFLNSFLLPYTTNQ